MKKIKTINKLVIAQDKTTGEYSIFTISEWSYGQGYRYPEYEGIEKIEEATELAKDFSR